MNKFISQLWISLGFLWIAQCQEKVESTPEQCSNKQTQFECDKVIIDGYEVHQPLLLPCCLASLIVGVFCGIQIFKQKKSGYLIYSIIFVLIGIMMTSAALLHCFLLEYVKQYPFLTLDIATIDDGLTTSIGFGFLLCTLVDLGFAKDSLKLVFIFLLTTSSILYFAYNGYYHGKIELVGLVYAGFVLVGCGSWVLAQLYLQINKFNCKGFSYLVLTGLFGFIGFIGIFEPKEQVWLCETFSCLISTDFIWFIVTPICAYLIYLYYLDTHSIDNTNKIYITNPQTLLVPANCYYNGKSINLVSIQNNSLQYIPRTELVSLQNI